MRTGDLPPGAQLPPVRALAGTLGVSPATVAKAYQELRQRGVIETAGRNGTRVRSRPAVAAGRAGAARCRCRPARSTCPPASPTPRLLPALGRAPAPARREAAAPVGLRATPAPCPSCSTLARARLAADGVPVDGAALTVTGGALDGIERLLTAHLRPGDAVAVEDPGWANLFDLVAALGLRAGRRAGRRRRPEPAACAAALASGARAVVITDAGAQPDRRGGQRRPAPPRCAGCCAAHPDVLVIEDDHAAELSDRAPAPARPARPAPGPSCARRPSRTDPTCASRCSPATRPPIARVVGRMRIGAGWVSTLLQRLVARLWQDDDRGGRDRGGRRQLRAAPRGAARRARRARAASPPGAPASTSGYRVPDETRAVDGAARRRLRGGPGCALPPGARRRASGSPSARSTTPTSNRSPTRWRRGRDPAPARTA